MDLVPRLTLSLSRSRSRSPPRARKGRNNVHGEQQQLSASTPPASGAGLAFAVESVTPSAATIEILSSTNGFRDTLLSSKSSSETAETNKSRYETGLTPQLVEVSFPSLLSPPNPAFIPGTESRGILVNARRPVRERSESIEEGDASAGQTPQLQQSCDSFTASAPTGPIYISEANTFANAISSKAPQVSGHRLVKSVENISESFENRKIRFAPLPDAQRPRRYSTGRDVWLKEHEHLSLARPASYLESWDSGELRGGLLSASFTKSADASFPATSPGSSLPHFSFSADDGGLPIPHEAASPSGNHRRSTSLASSTGKLFQSLGFGRSKNRDIDDVSGPMQDASPSPNFSSIPSSSSMTGSEGLRRIHSEAANGATSLEQERAKYFGMSSVSMQEAQTQQYDRPRMLYPSVAQGGVRKQDVKKWPMEATQEPEFVEWSNPTSSNPSEPDDDGSGMAWLKKRRKEREVREKEEMNESQPIQQRREPVRIEFNNGTAASEAQLAHATGMQDPASRLGEVCRPLSLFEQEKRDIDYQDEDDDGVSVRGSEGDTSTIAEREEGERLTEHVRRTTEGAGKEKYYNHSHQSFTHDLDSTKVTGKSPKITNTSADCILGQ